MLDAASLAAILDPERKVPGWWLRVCPSCGIDAKLGYGYGGSLPITVCKRCGHFLGQPNPFDRLVSSEDDYTGPDDLHTAREHAWRGEEWLEERGVGFSRSDFYVDGERTIATRCCYMRQSVPFEPIINHAAAIAEAVRRVNDGQK